MHQQHQVGNKKLPLLHCEAFQRQLSIPSCSGGAVSVVQGDGANDDAEIGVEGGAASFSAARSMKIAGSLNGLSGDGRGGLLLLLRLMSTRARIRGY